MEFVVRFIESPAELETCLAIRRAVFIGEQHVPESIEIDQWDSFAPNRHILLLSDGKAAGTARFRQLGEGIVKYQRIAVLPEFRGQGLGKILLEGLEQLAVQQGYQYVKIEAQQYAEGFYQRCGFATTDPVVFMDAEIPHLHMEKALIQTK